MSGNNRWAFTNLTYVLHHSYVQFKGMCVFHAKAVIGGLGVVMYFDHKSNFNDIKGSLQGSSRQDALLSARYNWIVTTRTAGLTTSSSSERVAT